MNFPVDEYARARATVLTGVVEDGPGRFFDAKLEISVVEYDVGRFSPELEGNPLDALGGGFHDRSSRDRRTRE